MGAVGKRARESSRFIWSGWPYLVVLFVSFLVGIFAGAVCAYFLDQSTELSDYLREYCVMLSQGELHVSFLSVLWDCIRWPLWAAVLGVTVLGIVGIPVLFLVRGFLLSFSACTFAVLLGYGGIAVAAGLFAVSVLLILPVLFILGCSGLQSACMHLPNAVVSGRKLFRIETILICVGILAISVAIQWTGTPVVLSFICSRITF